MRSTSQMAAASAAAAEVQRPRGTWFVAPLAALFVALSVAGGANEAAATSGARDRTFLDCYRLHFYAFPDGVGMGPYPDIQGCDGLFTDADRAEAHHTAMSPILVQVTGSSGAAPFYWGPEYISATPPDEWIRHTAILCEKPPYLVSLTKPPPFWKLCPNSPHSRLLTQAEFDRASAFPRGSGRGRNIQVKWFLSDRAAPTQGPWAPAALDSQPRAAR